LARRVFLPGRIRQPAAGLDVGGHLRQPVTYRLLVGQGPAERLALAHVGDRVLEGPIGHGDGMQAGHQPLALKDTHDLVEANALAAEQVLRGDAHVGKRQLGGVRGAHAHLVEGAAHAEARRVALDEEHRDAAMASVVAAGLHARRDEIHVGHRAIRDEHLGAVDDVVTAILHRARADGGHVAAAAGPGDGDGGHRLAAANGGQVLLLERLAARPVEMRRGHVAVDADRHRERPRARARALFVQHGRHHDVGAGAAVLLVVLEAQEAQLAHATEDRLGHLPRVLPGLHVRHDLFLHERPHRRSKHIVLIVEDFHGKPPWGSSTIQCAGVAPVRSRALPVLLTAIVGLGALSIDMFLPSLPAMKAAFDSDAATAQLTVTLFLAGIATSQLVWGPLSDRLGRRRVLLAGLGVYAVAGMTCAFAPTMGALIIARVVQALGAGSGPVIARAIVRDLYEPERAARVLAAMGTAQALTPILAPIVGGWVHVLAGWRAVFVVLGAFGVGFVLTTWGIVPETNVYAGTRAGNGGGGVAALLRHPRYLAYVAAAALAFSGQFAFITGSSFALIAILGVSPAVYGVCFGAVAGGLMAGNFVSVRLGPRLGIDTMIRGGTLI